MVLDLYTFFRIRFQLEPAAARRHGPDEDAFCLDLAVDRRLAAMLAVYLAPALADYFREPRAQAVGDRMEPLARLLSAAAAPPPTCCSAPTSGRAG
jgi:hypothetical protein